jgi:hypothetical protein
MCFESVQKSHLRSVRIDIVELPPRVNSKVTFQVLDRAKGSLFPVVRDREINSSDGHSNKIPIVYDKDAKFSRILESTSEYITQLLLQEMHQLEEVEKEYKSCGDFETIPFVQEAIEFTSKRLLGEKEPSKKSTQGKRESVSQKKKSNRNSIMEAKNHKDNVYTFYQLENGCYVVLHPLTMKCLTKEFIDKKPFVANEQEQLADSWIEQIPSSSSPSDATGSSKLEGFLPCQVTAKVVEVEHIVMDEDAERRYRFLNHLPMLSDFYLCELDLRGIVSQETLDFFKPELKKREKQRKAKAMKNLKESPSSPIFKLRQQDFNLQAHDQVSWPAPTPNDNNMDPNTQDLPDTFIESFEHGTQLLEGVESDNLAASPSFSASSSIYNEESSFATITRQSGYFPSLSNSVSSSSSRTNTGTTSSPSWVVPHQPLVDYSDPSITDQIKKNKKKSGKKGVSLFSTAQRRSYR